jgi:tetratricopeptide (TPR) repeat protein/DNA-binding CsgD family transcriptional regulator
MLLHYTNYQQAIKIIAVAIVMMAIKYPLKAQPDTQTYPEIDSIRQRLNILTTDTAKSHFLYESMRNFYNHAKSSVDYDKGEQCVVLLDSLARHSGNPAIYVEAFLGKSLVESRKGNTKESFASSKAALNWVQKTSDKNLLARTYDELADSYRKLENWDESLRYSLLALRNFEVLGNHIKAGHIYGDMTNLFIRQGNYKQAFDCAQKSVAIFNKIGTAEHLSVAYSQLAGATMGLDNAKDAIAYQLRSDIYLNEMGDVRNIAVGKNNLGEYYSRAGDQEKAISLVLESIDMIEKFGGKKQPNLIAKYLNLGIIYGRNKEYAKSEVALKRSIALADILGSQFRLMQGYEELANTYRADKQNEKAVDLYPKVLALRDSIFRKERVERMANLSIQYETEKKELQIAQLEEKNKNQLWIIWLAIAGVVLAVGLGLVTFSAYRGQRKITVQNKTLSEQEKTILSATNERLLMEKELQNEKNIRLQREIETKQRELASTSVYIQQKNQLLDDLQSQLQEASVYEGNTGEMLKQMSRTVKQQIRFDNDWEKIKIHFEGVHPDFFDELKRLSTSLSDHELRHCAYIKMKFSTKEIANLLGIDPNSVKVSRYRIKKKLVGDSDTDLVDFIHTI